ncbi:MAG: uracil-DNA glycosylase [Bradymonadales bacterium]|nr:uracil-DNA glycosylase [Bradymonadales bacterium]
MARSGTARTMVLAPDPIAEAGGPDHLLHLVQEDLGDCRRCKLSEGRNHIVFGEGDPQARLVFVGEAPGGEEDRKGRPFVGSAGQLLTKMIGAMGLHRDQVYICNVIKCRPPNNRDPEMDEVVACEPFLIRQLEVIRPEVIIAMGRVAAQTLLRVKTPITRLRGRWTRYHGIRLMPTFHPAYLLRNPQAKREVWADLKQVMAELDLAVPPRQR